MKDLYAKMTFRLVFISFLALILIGCSESGTPGGDSGPGVTASINLSAGEDSLPADGMTSTTITAVLLDSVNAPVLEQTPVVFRTNRGTFKNGLTEYRVSTADESGSVVVSLIAGTSPGTAEVSAESKNINQRVEITFTDISKEEPAFLTLGTSGNTVKTDNSDSVNITAVVLNAARAPVIDIPVKFTTISEDGSAGAGQISASTLLTDENGAAEITFSSGVGDKRNQIVTVEATVDEIGSKQIPIQVTGSYLIVTNEGEAILNLGGSSTTLKIAVRDAANAPVYDVPVTLSLAANSTGTVNFDPSTGRTDISGEFRTVLTGTGLGTAIVNAESIGATGTQVYKVEDPNKEFRIFEPAQDVTSLTTHTSQMVRVMAKGYQKIVFATSVGAWDGTEKRVITKQVENGVAQAVFMSSDAGTATIQVYPSDTPAITDSIRIAISAPSSEASKIFFQTSATVVAPSTSEVKNSVTLIAEVTNEKNQVVFGAPVLFSIITPIGGGEYVSPAIAFTDASGIVTSVFTSGSLVAGADGVQVRAELIDKDAFDTVSIIISGQAASLTIGHSTEVQTLNEETTYQLPMSVLVTDANGSPVKQSLVSLNLWPSHFRTGYWQYTLFSNGVYSNCIPIIEGTRPNEDVNRNLIMDEGEDINQDGQLTPPLSAAGAVPATLVTDETGIANFYLIYTKASSAWIVDELTASTVVSGTETRSTYRFVLPWAKSDAVACLLSDSPYFFEEVAPEVGSVTVSTGASAIVADGSSTATIRAIVNDTEGDPMGGVAVKFTTTLGTFNGASTFTAITSDSGVAMLNLKSGTFPGTATVTAEADGFTDQVKVTLTADGTKSLTLTALPPHVATGGSASIIAMAKDQFGNPVSNAVLYFDIYENNTGGSIGTTCSCGTCLTTTATATTDVNGRAIVYYCAGDRLEDEWGICTCSGDLIRVTLASNSEVTAETCIGVAIPNGIAGYITLTASSLNLPSAGSTGSTDITAKILDTAGSPMPVLTSISFTTTVGHFSNGGTTITLHTMDETGEIVFSLIVSGADIGQTAIITATSNGVTQSLGINIASSDTGVGGIVLDATLYSIPADGTTTTDITATITDMNGDPVPNGTPVTFEITSSPTDATLGMGGVTSIGATSGDTGVVSVTLTAGTIDETATVTATSGSVTSNPIAITIGAP